MTPPPVRLPASAPERQAAPPDTNANDEWVPLGPATVTRGRAAWLPRVAGRVSALAVSPDGTRIYAGTSLGGVWYSGDGGDHWYALDFYTSTADASAKLQHTDALTVGAIGVAWGNAATDVVYVGAGVHPALGSEPAGGSIQGAGIRQAVGPAVKVRPDPVPAAGDVDAARVVPWVVESADRGGLGVNQFAIDLQSAGTVWASTTRGLYRRAPASGATAAQWTPVVTPFADAELSAVVAAADVVAGEKQRLYVATTDGRVAFSIDGTAWTEIALPAFPESELPKPAKITRVRLAVAHGPANPVIYALADGPRLWRIDGNAAAVVTGLPKALAPEDAQGVEPFGLAIAAHPTNDAAHQDLIALGAQVVVSTDRTRQAALFVEKVQKTGSDWKVVTGGPTVPDVPKEWMGEGVLPGVQALAWVSAGATTHLWLGGDGGAYRFASDDKRKRLVERNTGLAVVDVTSFAQAATADAVLLAGTRGNGVLRRRGPAAWSAIQTTDPAPPGSEEFGAVGTVAIDPGDPRRMYVQRRAGGWRQSTDGGDTFKDFLFRTALIPGDTPDRAKDKSDEDKLSSPACPMALFDVPDDPRGTIKALGTNRIWYTDDALLNKARLATTATSAPSGWVTLPTAKDAYGGLVYTPAQDKLDGPVLACVWGSKDRLYALTSGCVYLFERQPDDSWKPFEKLYDQPAAVKSTKRKNPPPVTMQGLKLMSLALRQVSTGKGALYVGSAGAGDKTHLWYYDGSGNWIATGFMRDTPVYAIVVDPGADNVVYVGTRAGVFQGTGDFSVAGKPTWTWTQYSSGLPEAPCVGLSLYAPEKQKNRLLRAALAGRGVWEVALADADTTHTPHPQKPRVYLRAHAFDARNFDTPNGGMRDPTSATRAQVRLDASPDIRVRRRQTAAAPAPLKMKAKGPPYDKYVMDATVSDPYDVWLMQSASRAAGSDIDPDGPWSKKSADARDAAAKALSAPAAPPTKAIDIWKKIVDKNPVGVDRNMDAADVDTWVRDEPDRWPKGARASCSSVESARVYVSVHSRHWRPIPKGAVSVALLKVPLAAAGKTARGSLTNVEPLPAGWAAAVSAGAALGGSWSYAAATTTVASLIDSNNSGVVQFDVDLTGASFDTPGWLLLAVVFSAADPLVAVETNVAKLVHTDPHVAARSVRKALVLAEPIERYPGMDISGYPTKPTMDKVWAGSNMFFTGMYLESPRPVIADCVTANTHKTSTLIRNAHVMIAGKAHAVNDPAVGWAPPMEIQNPKLPAGTTIVSISADGHSITISADATGCDRGAALTVIGAPHSSGTGDIITKELVTNLSTNADGLGLGWVVGGAIGGAGIPLGTTIVHFWPDDYDPWIEMSKAATADAEHVELFTTVGNITAASTAVTAISENVLTRGWRDAASMGGVGMSIAGDGIRPGTTIQAIDAGGHSLTLSQAADANPATTKAGVVLKVGELLQPKPSSGHRRYQGLGRHGDEPWMHGWNDIHGDWGIAPIYWGQQEPANLDGPNDLGGTLAGARPNPPHMALDNARDALSKAIRASIPAGAVIYLDWEVGGKPSLDGVEYATKFMRRLGEFGYRPAAYCHPQSADEFARKVPGMFVWHVDLTGGVVLSDVDGQLVESTKDVLKYGLARQWQFKVTYPTSPIGFPPKKGDIDADAGIVYDPAFPERGYVPDAVSWGRAAVAPYGDTHSLIYAVRKGAPKVVVWTAPGPSAKLDEPFGTKWPFWWNAFSAAAAVRIPPPGSPPAASAPSTDLLLAVGVLKSTDAFQARGDWRIIAARRRTTEQWSYDMVPANGLAIDPLVGVAAVRRSDRSVDVFAVDEETGEIVVSRWDPASTTSPNAWTSLAHLSTPTGEIRRTSRIAAVSRTAGVADIFWVRPTKLPPVNISVAAAPRVAPIQITTAAPHGLSTGDPVLIKGVAGNIAANGIFTVTVVNPTTLRLDDDTRASGVAPAGGSVIPIDGGVYTSNSAAGTPTDWSAPVRIGPANVRVHPLANVAAVSAANSRIDVLFIGRADGTSDWSLYHVYWTAAGWDPAHAIVVGATLAPSVQVDPLVAIAACSRGAGSVDAFVAGTDGVVYYASLDTAANTWSAFHAVGGGGHVVSIEGAANVAPSGGIVITTDRDGRVFASTWDTSAASYAALREVSMDP